MVFMIHVGVGYMTKSQRFLGQQPLLSGSAEKSCWVSAPTRPDTI